MLSTKKTLTFRLRQGMNGNLYILDGEDYEDSIYAHLDKGRTLKKFTITVDTEQLSKPVVPTIHLGEFKLND